MGGTGPDPVEYSHMSGRPVTHMLAEPVGGVAIRESLHQLIPIHLGDNGRCSDARVLLITLDDRRLGLRNTRNRPRIDEHVFDRYASFETLDGAAHRLERRLVDPDLVDLFDPDLADSDTDGHITNFRSELLAQFRPHPLRIIETDQLNALRKHDGGRNNRTGQRTDPDLIDARDAVHSPNDEPVSEFKQSADA